VSKDATWFRRNDIHPTLTAVLRAGAVMTSNTRLWAILTTLAGLASLAVTVGFRILPEVAAAQAAGCGGPQVIAFEFARTVAEALRLFQPDSCRASLLTAMDAANRLDVWAYIPTYTLFGVFGAIFAARGARPPLVLLAILAAITALVADYVETTTLLKITADLAAATDAMTVRASTAAWIKFGALAVHGLLVAGVCLQGAPRRWILGLALVAPAIGFIPAAIDPARWTAVMTLGFLIGWLVLLAFAAKEAVWPPKGS
jgi:hypothetical protein